jgi:hypothetical protein
MRPSNFPKTVLVEKPTLDEASLEMLFMLKTNCKGPNNDYAFEDEDLMGFYESHICVSMTKAVFINKETTAQGTKLWRHERKLRITASVCYQLFTYKLNRNANWEKKFANIHKDFSNSATIYGKKTEKLAFECYKQEEPDVKSCGLAINPDLCWLGCSPDGIVVAKRKILEIKCPTAFEKTDVVPNQVSFLKQVTENNIERYILKEKHPFYGQIQLNLHILNCETADLVIYSKFAKRYIKVVVPYDYKFTTTLVNRLKTVYFENLLPIIYQDQKQTD